MRHLIKIYITRWILKLGNGWYCLTTGDFPKKYPLRRIYACKVHHRFWLSWAFEFTEYEIRLTWIILKPCSVFFSLSRLHPVRQPFFDRHRVVLVILILTQWLLFLICNRQQPKAISFGEESAFSSQTLDLSLKSNMILGIDLFLSEVILSNLSLSYI